MIELTLLGTTAGIPTRGRGHASIALRYEGDIILFDCGENTQRQMISANLSPMKIKCVLITHWHADHFAGLPGLIQSLSLRDRTEPLYIYGPKETRKFVNVIKTLGYFTPCFKIIVNEIKTEGIVFKEDKFMVYALPVSHGIPALAYKFVESEKPGKFNVKKARKLGLKEVQFGKLQKGERIKTKKGTVKPSDVVGPARKGLSVVYSGDTGFSEKMIKFAKDTDLLIHESTFGEDMRKRANKVGHSTAKQAAKIAKRANVKKLLLTHISGRYENAAPLLKEAKENFKTAQLGRDLMKITLK